MGRGTVPAKAGMVEGLATPAAVRSPSVSPAGCHLPIASRQGGFHSADVRKKRSARDDRPRVLSVTFGRDDDRARRGALVDGVRARIADRAADALVGLARAVDRAGLDRAARGGATEQGLERLLRGGA